MFPVRFVRHKPVVKLAMGRLNCKEIKMKINNIFSGIPDSLPEEIFDRIVETGDLKVERIVSWGQATPEQKWYDQEWDEWVLVLSGEAGLIFEGQEEICRMKTGDHIHIPARVRHRVAWTKENEKTVWLAVHYKNTGKKDAL